MVAILIDILNITIKCNRIFLSKQKGKGLKLMKNSIFNNFNFTKSSAFYYYIKMMKMNLFFYNLSGYILNLN